MSDAFDAWHLPGSTPDESDLRIFQARALSCRFPAPSPALLEPVITRLHRAGSVLAARSTDDLIRVIDAAAERLADPADPLRREAEDLLPRATGYSAAMVRLVLDRMAADWRTDALRRLIDVELGGAAALDGFAGRDEHARTAAIGPRLAFHVFSGNVPGVAVTSLVRALLVKAPSLGKLAGGEPVLPVLFGRAVTSVDPAVGEALAITYWPGGDRAAEDLALDAADAVIVYGGDEAVAAIGGRARAGQRLVLHGPRISVGAVGTGELEGGLKGAAARAARAVATFDQQGCVSPHALWVEGPDTRAAGFAAHLAEALDRLADELPRADLTAAEASAIQQERGAAEMRSHGDPRVRVWAGGGTAWTVVLEPGDRVRASCLNRFVRVHPIDDLALLPEMLEPIRDRLQSVALEGAGDRDDRLARALARAGASRVTTLERLPWPPPHAHHDGAPPLRELLRWTDREI